MKWILPIVLAAGWASAQTNEYRSLGLRPDDGYTRRVQMHTVPLDFKGPDQLQREAEREERQRNLRAPEAGVNPLAQPDITVPPPRAAGPAARRKDDQDEDDPKRKRGGLLDAKDEKKTASGWGWLADEVRQSDEKRERAEAPDELEDEPDEDDPTPATNRTVAGAAEWSGERRDQRERGREGESRWASARVEERARRDEGTLVESTETRRSAEPTPEEPYRPAPWLAAISAPVAGSPPAANATDTRTLLAPANDSASLNWNLSPGFSPAGGSTPGLLGAPEGRLGFQPALASPVQFNSTIAAPVALTAPAASPQLGDLYSAGSAPAGGGLAPRFGEPLRSPVADPRPAGGLGADTPGVRTKTLPW